MAVDKDGDARINMSEFIMAMSLIRQAKQQENVSSSLPVSGVSVLT